MNRFEGLRATADVFVACGARGKYDALTGRWVVPEDDLDEMLRRIEEVDKDELYKWSFRGLKKNGPGKMNHPEVCQPGGGV